jgi:hypothetical protein
MYFAMFKILDEEQCFQFQTECNLFSKYMFFSKKLQIQNTRFLFIYIFFL